MAYHLSTIDPADRAEPLAGSTVPFLGLVAEKLAAAEELFRRRITDSDVPFIEETGRYVFEGGGKRVRPALLLLASQILGHDGDEEITYAAVIELIHSATLIHDDIIDNAHLRRGRPTVNRLWDNHKTVLLGDWIYTTSLEMALAHDQVEVLRAICGATLRMTEGELLALDRLGAADLTVEEYFQIIERKTAHLFSAACTIPTLIPGSPEGSRQALGRYGRNLGICFQLVDDLLDFKAREDELGKPVLSDLKEGKLTLPILLALPRIDGKRRERIRTVLEDRSFRRTSPEEVLEIVASEGTLDEVAETAERYGKAARAELERFPESPAREALQAAPDFVLRRRS